MFSAQVVPRSIVLMFAFASLGLAACGIGVTGFPTNARGEEARLYVGTYTGSESGSKGIYTARLDLATGQIKDVEVAAELVNPSFLAIHPAQKFLYSVNEADAIDGKQGGAVTAFAIDPAGKLKRLNQQSSAGAGPCHLVVDGTGKCVLVANYGGGSIAALPIKADGSLGEASSRIQHTGSSVNKQRQESPHAHSINIDKGNRFAFAADLGLDKVLIYKLDAAQGKLTPNDPPSAAVKPGAGPRHFAFHPNGKFAYVINEIDMTVTAFSYAADRGALEPIQTVPTIHDPYEPRFSTAEVRVHPSGKFLYGSNRGHDTIVAFKIDQATGKLTHVENESTQGKTPRNFEIDPTGAFLLAENQDSGTIVVLKIDPATGELSPTGHSATVARPVCIRFLSPR